MGIITSCLDIIGLSLKSQEEIVENCASDGSKTITTRRKNPWISGISIVAVTTIVLIYMDNGKGTISTIFGKRLIQNG